MGLFDELKLAKPIENLSHQALLSIVLTSDLLTKEGDRLLRPYNLTDAQFNVLMLLRYQAESQGLNQTEISQMLFVNRANVTGLVDRLEREAMIRRVPKPGDRRLNQIVMTPKGQTVLNKAEKEYFQRVEELLGTISKKDRGLLVELLEKIRKGLTSA
jgi:DNA-binding MarR family transcriptional regulator